MYFYFLTKYLFILRRKKKHTENPPDVTETQLIRPAVQTTVGLVFGYHISQPLILEDLTHNSQDH